MLVTPWNVPPTLLLCCVAAAASVSTAAYAADPPPSRAALHKRIELLERQLGELRLAIAEMKARAAPAATPAAAALPAPPAPAALAAAAGSAPADDKLSDIEQRLTSLETNAVLSEPKTVVKASTVYVDKDGNQYDQPTPGAEPTLTYQRERVLRRQSISEEVADALDSANKDGIRLGLSNVTAVQYAGQTRGADTEADGNLFGYSTVDITLAATSAALNTSFFADIVGAGGSTPDREIPALNLINAQTARLSNNQVSLREAWLMTQIWDRQLSFTLGRVDLTNTFDRNTVANDETSQFLNDALVNNPVLALTSNGFGLVAVYDPKGSFSARLGVQQSNDDATSLSTSRYVLGEVEYLGRPFSLPEGHYRLWARVDNSTGSENTGHGLSIDQKITPALSLFGRYGRGFVGPAEGKMRFYSLGIGGQAPLTFYPTDTWGLGYASTRIEDGPNAATEWVVEGHYNWRLTGSLYLSALLQYLNKSSAAEAYLLPGMRMQVSF